MSSCGCVVYLWLLLFVCTINCFALFDSLVAAVEDLFLRVVHSVRVLWAFHKGRWTKMGAPVTVPRQVALTHSCWQPHRQFV